MCVSLNSRLESNQEDGWDHLRSSVVRSTRGILCLVTLPHQPLPFSDHPPRPLLAPTSNSKPPYLRLIHSCITQLKSQGPSRTCNESKEEPAQRKSASTPRGIHISSAGTRMSSRSKDGRVGVSLFSLRGQDVVAPMVRGPHHVS